MKFFLTKDKPKLDRQIRVLEVLGLGIILLIAIVCIALYFVFVSDTENSSLLVLLAVMVIISIIITFMNIRKVDKKKDTDYRMYLQGRLNEGIDKSETSTQKSDVQDQSGESIKESSLRFSKADNSNKDIIALMLKNNDETTEYFSISKKQAKSSFSFSIIACSIGIILLISAVLFAIIIERIDVAIIAGVSGAITEVIAGTVLWVHNKSALQLNHYYKALHENEKFLSAINLVNHISKAKRDEVYIEVIRKQLQTVTEEEKPDDPQPGETQPSESETKDEEKK